MLKKRPLFFCCLLFAAGMALLLATGGETLFCSAALKEEGQFVTNEDIFFQGSVKELVQKEQQTVVTLEKAEIWRKDSGSSGNGKREAKSAESESWPCRDLLVYLKGQERYALGETLTGCGKLQKIEKPGNYGQFDARNYYNGKGIDFRIFSGSITGTDGKKNWYLETLDYIQDALNQGIQAVFPEEDQGLLASMLLGDKENLNEDVYSLYQLAGIAHLLAISGLHMGMAGRGLYGLLRKLGASFGLSFFFSLLLLVSYGFLTGMGPSALRALVMFGLAMFAKVCGRSNDLLTSSGVALALMVAGNPWYLTQSGVWLSFGAVFAIGGIFPVLQRWFRSKNPIVKSLLLSFSIQVFTIPILCYSYFQFSLYSVFLNLIVIPLMSVVFISGFAGAALGIFWPAIGKLPGGMAHYILRFYEGIANIFTNLPGNLVLTGKPEIWQLCLYYALLGLLLFGLPQILKRRTDKLKKGKTEEKEKGKAGFRRQVVCLLVLLLLPFLLLRHSPKGLMVTMLDVGQGDGIYLKTPEGRSFFFDGGSSDVKEVGTYRILPYLKAMRKNKIDVWAVSHGDSDHYSGLLEVFAQVEKGEFFIDVLWLPDVANPGEGYEKLERQAAALGIPVEKIRAGESWREGSLSLTCIHPAKGYVSESENAYSMTLLLEFKKFRGLFTGDVEKGGEEAVKAALEERMEKEKVKNGEDKEGGVDGSDKLTLLKVAHHGSKNSTTEAFCRNLKADFAWISVGAENSYSHPAKEVLERLSEMGAQTDKTMESGALLLITDGETLEIKRYREKK